MEASWRSRGRAAPVVGYLCPLLGVNMRRFAALLVALLTVMTAAADDAKEKAVKAELEKLRGKWKQVSSEVGGKERAVPDELASKTIVTIDGTKWTVEGPEGKKEVTFSIDPTQNPKTWDRIRKGKDDAGKGVVDQCIYKLDGDTLTICSGYTPRPGQQADGTAERPKEFKTTGGGSVVVFKRVKE